MCLADVNFQSVWDGNYEPMWACGLSKTQSKLRDVKCTHLLLHEDTEGSVPLRQT